MTEAANFQPRLLYPEQDSQENQPEKIWERQKNEPAKLYLTFRRYLDMGTKRSLRALVASEPATKKATKTLSDVSIPGNLKRASKVWHWVERAEAYDLDQMEKQAQYIRQFAGNMPFASKAYRIIELSWLGRELRKQFKTGIELRDYLALATRYQAVMKDLKDEMEGLEVAMDSVDAAAFKLIQEEAEQQEFEAELKNADMYKQNMLKLDKYEREHG